MNPNTASTTTPQQPVKNAWYVAATVDEVSHAPVARRILGLPVLIYRDVHGVLVAMLDRCPHRRFPLSRGVIEDDGVRCGYHGMKFAPDGRCVDIPCQPRVGGDLRVRTFEVVEMADWIWIWTGAEPANDQMPPRAPEFTAQSGWYRRQLLNERVQARTSILHDNLLDLSHVSFLHATNIGGSGVAEAKPDVQVTPFGLSVRREMLDPKMHELPLGKAMALTGTVVRVMAQQFYAPSLHITGSAFFHPDRTGRAGEPIGSFRVLHAITPESATTTHYFQGYQRDFLPGDEHCNHVLDAALRLPIPEDVMASELIEAELAVGVDLEPERHIAGDVIALRGRRLMEDLVNREAERR